MFYFDKHKESLFMHMCNKFANFLCITIGRPFILSKKLLSKNTTFFVGSSGLKLTNRFNSEPFKSYLTIFYSSDAFIPKFRFSETNMYFLYLIV